MQASNLYNVTESDNKLVDLFFFPSSDFTNIHPQHYDHPADREADRHKNITKYKQP